jgi:hypothetical protein
MEKLTKQKLKTILQTLGVNNISEDIKKEELISKITDRVCTKKPKQKPEVVKSSPSKTMTQSHALSGVEDAKSKFIKAFKDGNAGSLRQAYITIHFKKTQVITIDGEEESVRIHPSDMFQHFLNDEDELKESVVVKIMDTLQKTVNKKNVVVIDIIPDYSPIKHREDHLYATQKIRQVFGGFLHDVCGVPYSNLRFHIFTFDDKTVKFKWDAWK